MITLGGKAGAGKGTVSKLIAADIGYAIVDIGATKRALAETMGLSIVEFDILGDQPGNAEKFDLSYETYQQGLDPMGSTILDSRLGFYNQPKAFNVFLEVDAIAAAERIFAAKRNTDAYASVAEVLSMNEKRSEKLQVRYMKLYNIDFYDMAHYDVVIDTTHMTPEATANKITQEYVSWKNTTTSE